MELLGTVLYLYGAKMDMVEPRTTDKIRIIYATAVLFTLLKFVYLVRVFRHLNFLMTLFNTVVKDVLQFLILYTFFVLTFAQSFSTLNVDQSSYGRVPALFANFVSVFRCSIGEFSILHPFMTFDIVIDPDGLTDEEKFMFSYPIVVMMFIVFIVCVFFVHMIFMNFIIAVIGESFEKVIENK